MKTITFLGTFLVLAAHLGAADTLFKKSKLVQAVNNKDSYVDASIRLSDKAVEISPRGKGMQAQTIAYDSITGLTYDYSKKRRVKQGAMVMVASLGAGAIVMLTKSKNHWLTIDHGSGKSTAFKLDKSEFEDVIQALESRTGKKAAMLGETANSKIRGQGETGVSADRAEPRP